MCSVNLKLTAIDLKFRNEMKTTGILSMGLPCKNIECLKTIAVTDASFHDDDNKIKMIKHHLKTDQLGYFPVKVPENTVELYVKVKFSIECCVGFVKYQKCKCKKNTKSVTLSETFKYYTLQDTICRTIDGVANNITYPNWGSANQMLARPDQNQNKSLTRSRAITNQQLSLNDPELPNPRFVSNAICQQTESVLNSARLTDMVWGWGQFLDHEIDLTPDGSGESANIETSALDPYEAYPNRTIPFHRSIYIIDSNNDRQQLNVISSFIDASNVYGSSTNRQYHLRSLDGTGKLKVASTDHGDLLMNNSQDLPNANPTNIPPEQQFLAGDIRANENILLIAMHTLFVREHNRLCDLIIQDRPEWIGKDELIYQEARRRVSAMMQVITYNEFLPAILGQPLPPYTGYNPTTNPNISNEFSTAAYRLGHSMVSSTFKLLNPNNPEAPATTVPLRDTFFNPNWIRTNGFESLILGASNQIMQELDHRIVDDLRNFLFGPPTATTLLDLASLNIQRGRDHNLLKYNDLRMAYGLQKHTTWADITNDPTLQSRLATLYGPTPDNLDPWLGGLLEAHLPDTTTTPTRKNSQVGELINAILVDQFTRLRDGDIFYFENDQSLSPEVKEAIRSTKLSAIINRNTGLNLRSDIFRLP